MIQMQGDKYCIGDTIHVPIYEGSKVVGEARYKITTREHIARTNAGEMVEDVCEAKRVLFTD